jgi:hypothetical protein
MTPATPGTAQTEPTTQDRILLNSLRHLEIGGLTAGALWLRLRQKYGHGLKTAYYRDRVRLGILNTAPVVTPERSDCEVHVLTSKGDWLNLLWTLKSFYRYSASPYSLCVHEDGSLDREQIETLRSHLPGARIVSRPEADALVEPLLADRPLSKAFRDRNPLALKVFDLPAMLQAGRMLLLDSDVLFFAPPRRLCEILDDPQFTRNSLNRDWTYGYSIEAMASADSLGFELPELINSGLGLVHRGSIDLDWVETFLALPGILSHHHRVEQTLIALCSARFGFEFLPPEYDVHVGARRSGAPCRHYTGPIRHLLYREGLRRLRRAGLLDD